MLDPRQNLCYDLSFSRFVILSFLLCCLVSVASPGAVKDVCREVQALGVQNGSIPDSAITATSYANSQRKASNARLHGKNAWTSNDNNFFQYLEIRLGGPRYITHILTQGRDRGNEWVQEYRVDYSDDTDETGSSWKPVRTADGETKSFLGNIDSDTVKENELEDPIIASRIRINPIRWNHHISMRVEIKGCIFHAYTASFTGVNYITREITSDELKIKDERNHLRLRFRTIRPQGLLFYATNLWNSRGDYLAVQIKDGSVVVSLDLGSTPDQDGSTTVVCGSLLDDNQWHDVVIDRESKNISVTVDRLRVTGVSKGPFTVLDIDDSISIGGVKNPNQRGILVQENFRGCIENVIMGKAGKDGKAGSAVDLIEGAQKSLEGYKAENGVSYTCVPEKVIPVTFPTVESYMKINQNDPKLNNLQARFDIRSYSDDGLLMEHKFAGDGSFRVFLKKGLVTAALDNIEGMKDFEIPLETDSKVNDGLWHQINVELRENFVNVTVDMKPYITQRKLNFGAGATFHLGGHPNMLNDLYRGFVGCMRNIQIDLKAQQLDNIQGQIDVQGATINECNIMDRCSPNPCEHGGQCKQTWDQFECQCEDGYGGAVCHTSIHPPSCEEYRQVQPNRATAKKITLDIDGSGPLRPFEVDCRFTTDEQTRLPVTDTIIHHELESNGAMPVDGYQEAGSYGKKIRYNVDKEQGEKQIYTLIDRAKNCYQNVRYRCRNAKFFDRKSGKQPMTWWIGRGNQKMYYWGNAPPGSYKCACAFSQGEESCKANKQGESGFCNCDSGEDTWLIDEGRLEYKDDLPVLEMRVGDTGTMSDQKSSEFEINELSCRGDLMYDNAVTLFVKGARLSLPTFDGRQSGDIRFQFRTTATSGLFLRNDGIGKDFIEVRLVTNRVVNFRYDVGNGIQLLSVESSSDLNDNQWHTVQMERNRKEARLRVDQNSPIIRAESSQGHRALSLGDNPLYVGSDKDYKDGFVGCIRAFTVNGVLMDLVAFAEDKELTSPKSKTTPTTASVANEGDLVSTQKFVFGVKQGCVGKCDSSPCFNKGICEEKYDTFWCDCTFTAFRGPFCSDEIGTNMKSNTMIKMKLPVSSKTTATKQEIIGVAFTTTERKGLLLEVQSDVKSSLYNHNEFFQLTVQNNGGLMFKFDYGFGIQIINDDRYNYANGQHHNVTITRADDGRKVSMRVDYYEPQIWTFDTATADSGDVVFDSPRFMYIGMNESYGVGNGFVGCISRVQFGDIFPLKWAMKQDYPYPGITVTGGPIHEDWCGNEPVTPKPDIAPTRPNDRLPSDVHTITPLPYYISSGDQAVIGGVLALLFLALIIVAIIIGRYVARHKGVYRTHEAKGADEASNADEAVGLGLGSNVNERKAEYYI